MTTTDRYNYEEIIDWFWDNVPYLPNYKSYYGTLFFFYLNAIKKNGYNPIAIQYEQVLNVNKISRMMYMEGRLWLFEKGLISSTLGMNTYRPATYKLGVVLLNILDGQNKAA